MYAKVVSALANFGVNYNFSSISVVLLYFAKIYGTPPSWASALLTSSVFGGCIIGMVLIGLLGDIFGRITAFVIALSCASLGALLSAYGSYGNVQTLCWLIALWRVILGIGIGGIYPISSVFAYEYDDDNESDGEKTTESSKRELIDGSTRSAMALFWQLPGQMAVYVFAILLYYTGLSYDIQWRLMLVIGMIPFLSAIFIIIQNRERFESFFKRFDNENVYYDHQSTYNHLQSIWLNDEHRLKLIGVMSSFFVFDAYIFGVVLYSPIILAAIFGGTDTNMVYNFEQNIFVLIVTLPAAFISIIAIEYHSLRNLQLVGFAIAALACTLFAIMWIQFKNSEITLFASFCVLKISLAFFVPSTTFTMPNILFPRTIRASCSGASNAAGKFGAFVGAFLFPLVYDSAGMVFEMFLCSLTAFVGVLVTIQFIPKYSEFDDSYSDNNEMTIAVTSDLSKVPIESDALLSFQKS